MERTTSCSPLSLGSVLELLAAVPMLERLDKQFRLRSVVRRHANVDVVEQVATCQEYSTA